MVLATMLAIALSAPVEDPGIATALAQVRKLLPTEGRLLFDPERIDRHALTAPEAFGTAEWKPVEGQPFRFAASFEVPRGAPNGFSCTLHSPANGQPILKGDTVMYAMWMRGEGIGGGEALVPGFIERGSPSWEGLASQQTVAGNRWRPVYIVATAANDYPAGSVVLSLHMSARAHRAQVGGIVGLNLGQGLDVAKLPVTRVTYRGMEPNAPWRKAAAARIDRLRKAPLTVRVVDGRGRPVRNAQVQATLQRHEFLFGSFLEDPVLRTNADGDRYRSWFKRLFTTATTPMYWADWGWANPEVRANYLKMAEWLQKERIPTKAHVLIYPGRQFMPAATMKLENDPAAFRKALMDHIQEILDETRRFNFISWDITNETRDLKEFPAILGSEEIYADLFKEAHRIDPRPIFYLNENTIVESNGETESQQAEFERMLRYLQAQGAPLEGIGIQGHFGEGLTPPDRVLEILDRFGKFKLPIQITEFDIVTRDEAAQGAYTRDFLTAVFSHPSITGFTMWGFWEGQMWQPIAAMFRKDWTIKPNGRAYLDLLEREWRTNVRRATDARGQMSVRGFRGTYAVTVRQGNRTVRREVRLSKGGANVTVTLR